MWDMLASLTGSKEERGLEIIRKSTGVYLFFYYQYVDRYKLKPVSLDDLVNGLLYIQADAKLKDLK